MGDEGVLQSAWEGGVDQFGGIWDQQVSCWWQPRKFKFPSNYIEAKSPNPETSEAFPDIGSLKKYVRSSHTNPHRGFVRRFVFRISKHYP